VQRRAVHLLAVLVAAFVTFVNVAPAAHAEPQSAPPKAYILVDADSGAVLGASHEHDALPPASTSKLMTALTAVERLPPDAEIGVSPLAAAQPASRINMQPGQKWKFVDALASLMIVSANDAAYAIAETTSGNLDAFAKAETETAQRYGMRDSTFSDPAGLDDAQSYKGGPRMSAYDIAISARNALDVPELALFAAMQQRKFTDPTGLARTLVNHNRMLPGSTRCYAGATGMKTGFTNLAGHTLVATATRNGRTLIAVIMNTYDTYGWAAQLLDYGFATPLDTKGTGAKLPAVAVSPYAQRLTDRTGFLALVNSSGSTANASPVADTTTTTTPAGAAAVAGTTAPPTTAATPSTNGAAAAGARSAAGDATTTAAQDTGSSWFSLRNVVIAVVVLLVVLVMLRRRAVRRQRARRMAQRRAVRAAMRRGSLPVVDGRYRTGTRVGPLLESHVRVHRLGDDRRR
jgi:serine-type D-Ala-D-Ala carboxypeptidase (penicillin-binding protein 5/6)